MLREFSNIVKITDSKGRPVGLSHTHRFRHTKLTRLAELGLPIHVLQRYAGHASPTMSMHYIAQREEHAEQAFLATAKLKADGTRVSFSREDHDSLHLFDRADRFLPHGWRQATGSRSRRPPNRRHQPWGRNRSARSNRCRLSWSSRENDTRVPSALSFAVARNACSACSSRWAM